MFLIFLKVSIWGPATLLFNACPGSFPGVTRTVRHLHLVPKLRMGTAILRLPLYAFMAWTGITLPFYRDQYAQSMLPEVPSIPQDSSTTDCMVSIKQMS